MLMRNQQTDFSKVAHIKSPRSKFNRISEHATTFNQGDLIPFYNDIDILPGDTHSYTTSFMIRTVAPLRKPITGNLKLDYWYFYIPYTQLWNIDHCKALFGEATDSAWVNSVEYTTPKLKFLHNMFGSNNSVDANGNIAMKTDTLGGTALTQKDFVTKFSNSIEKYLFFPNMPVTVTSNNMYTVGFKDENNKYCAFQKDLEVNAWTLRGYHRCYNYFFRREDLIAPVALDTSDTTKVYSGINDFTKPYKVSKYKDYFVSNLPQPQKSVAGDVKLPIGQSAPVIGNGMTVGLTDGTVNAGLGLFSSHGLSASEDNYGKNVNVSNGTELGNTYLHTYGITTDPTKSGIIADLSNAVSATVNSLRLAVATQRLYEKFASFGSRLEETISGQFQVNCPELALQIPEYLGGYTVPINITEVTDLSTSLGNVGAKSVTTHVKHDVTKSFTQWGIVLGLCAVRQNHLYANGIERGYFRTRIFDYYWPSFAHIGEQPTMNEEIFAFNRQGETFGFHEAWAEYKYKPSRISGQILDFNDFNTYVMADNYADCPYLGQSWIEENDHQLRYAMGLADDNPANDFIGDFAVLDTAVRPMPLNSVPGLMDHF